MVQLVAAFNSVFGVIFGVLFSLIGWMGPFLSMVVFSCVVGAIMVWVFGKVSNQEAIDATRRRMSAELIGLRLFKDDLRVFFGIQLGIGVWTLRYIRHSIVPMLIIMGPVLALLTQLNLRYGVAGVEPGDSILLKVTVRDAAALADFSAVSIGAPESVVVEAGGVRIPDRNEVSWRIKPETSGIYDLSVRVGEDQVDKQLVVGSASSKVSSLRSGESWVTNFLYPGEKPIPRSSNIASVELLYEDGEMSFLGLRLNWLIVFLVVSLVFGFMIKDRLGVSI